MKQPRALVLVTLFVIMTGLFVAALGSGAPPSSSFSGAPPPPTAVSTRVATPAPMVTAAPMPLPCSPGNRVIRLSGPRHGKVVPLESLPATCGCPTREVLRHPATWHHHTITHGLQLTGTCSAAVFSLGKHYSEISGAIYVDNSTGTTGGIISLVNAVVPTGSNTYRTLFESNIGYEKENMVSFRAPVRGVEYLAVWERCCTMQNTIVDVVATLTR
jgi:hypothetical protein